MKKRKDKGDVDGGGEVLRGKCKPEGQICPCSCHRGMWGSRGRAPPIRNWILAEKQ
jgi:hypothetical protein